MSMPTEAQVQALQEFASKYGRCWKSTLVRKWYNGSDDREPNGAFLRQVRNQFGPSWLKKFKLPEGGVQ